MCINSLTVPRNYDEALQRSFAERRHFIIKTATEIVLNSQTPQISKSQVNDIRNASPTDEAILSYLLKPPAQLR